jgi:hypothetical protein
MADTDRGPDPEAHERTVRQGEPTYDDAGAEAARRSRHREVQRYEDTGWAVNAAVARQAGPELGSSGQGQFGAGGFAGGGMGQSGYGADYAQRQNAQDSFGGEDRAHGGGKEEG